MNRQIARYLERHCQRVPSQAVVRRGPPRASVWVVIPAYDELDYLHSTLNSLDVADGIAVVVVVNASEDSNAGVLERNNQLIEELNEREGSLWVLDFSTERRLASGGVGAARRVGFDFVMKHVGREHPDDLDALVIASLDADSPVGPGWATQVRRAAREGRSARTWFEHGLEGPHGPAAATYELWLRYLQEGMRRAGSIYAYDVLGCAFVVTPHDYAVVRGMPRREFTEDFHFVNKVVKVQPGTPMPVLTDARVFPSSRVSDRVSVGTGPAIAQIEDGSDRYTRVPPPETFGQIAALYKSLDVLWELEQPPGLSDHGRALWNSPGWSEQVARLVQNSADLDGFSRAFGTWFDALRALRFFNLCAESAEHLPILDAVDQVFDVRDENARSTLVKVREKIRGGLYD